MYTVELGDGSVQQVAGEELVKAYSSPAGTFIVRSLHAMAVVDITPPRATHFVVGVADENGDVTELASWALDAASKPAHAPGTRACGRDCCAGGGRNTATGAGLDLH